MTVGNWGKMAREWMTRKQSRKDDSNEESMATKQTKTEKTTNNMMEPLATSNVPAASETINLDSGRKKIPQKEEE